MRREQWNADLRSLRIVVDLRINETPQTGAVKKRTYRGTKANPPRPPYQGGKLGNRT